MKWFALIAQLAATLAVLAASQDVQAGGQWPSASYPTGYGYPTAGYNRPAYYSPGAYRPAAAARQVPASMVEVGAVNRVGFVPSTVSVTPGTTVRWISRGREAHTVTSRDGLFNSVLQPGGYFNYTFTRPGTYRYYCRPHERMGMVGTVVVSSPGNGGGASAPGGTGY
jgi:plastocyanin